LADIRFVSRRSNPSQNSASIIARRIVVALVVGLALGASAKAQMTTTYYEYFGSSNSPLQVGSPDFPVTLAVPDFNSSLGTLESVTLTLTSTVGGSVEIYNLTNSPQSFTNAFATMTVDVTGPDKSAVSVTPSAFVPSGIANAGVYVLTSFTPDSSHGNGTASASVKARYLGEYEAPGGLGTVDLTLSSSGSGSYGGAALLDALAFAGAADAYGDVKVVYEYRTAIPEPAEYAAILGSASVGLALLRRRKGPGGRASQVTAVDQ